MNMRHEEEDPMHVLNKGGAAVHAKQTINAPIVLGSGPSSGSTLLHTIIARIDGISTGEELAILDKRDLFYASESYYRRHIHHWLTMGVPCNFASAGQRPFATLRQYDWTREEINSLCLACSSYPEMLDRFFTEHQERTCGRRWLEKTPDNVFAFQEISNTFANGKIVEIVRDGRDVVASLTRRGYAPMEAAARWFYATLTGLQYYGQPNYYMLHYEDLVAAPERTAEQLCDFLGEAFGDHLLRPDNHAPPGQHSWRYSHTDPVSAGSVGQHADAKFEHVLSVLKHIAVSSHGKRQLSFESARFACETAIDLQSALGYSTERLVDARRMTLAERFYAKREIYAWQMRTWKRYRSLLHSPVVLCK